MLGRKEYREEFSFFCQNWNSGLEWSNYLCHQLSAVLYCSSAIYRRGSYTSEIKVVKVLRPEFQGNTSLVPIPVSCAIPLLQQLSSCCLCSSWLPPHSCSPRYPWQGAALWLEGGIPFPFRSHILILESMGELGEPGAASLSWVSLCSACTLASLLC